MTCKRCGKHQCVKYKTCESCRAKDLLRKRSNNADSLIAKKEYEEQLAIDKKLIAEWLKTNKPKNIDKIKGIIW